MILDFNKPNKIRKTEEHNDYYSSDSMVPGTYVPNMSNEDIEKWKAKLKYKNTDHPQIEIRKDSFVIVVAYNGYKYKHYDRNETRDINVHIASAGPIQLTFEEWKEMKIAVLEAKEILNGLSV